MKRILLFGVITMLMTNVLHAKVEGEEVDVLQQKEIGAVEAFIKKYENQGAYVEMSEDILASISKLYWKEQKLPDPNMHPFLLLFKGLTLTDTYWDELQKAIEQDGYERKSYSKSVEELSTAWYTRCIRNRTHAVLITRSYGLLSVVYLMGTDITMLDLIELVQMLKRYSGPGNPF